MTTIDQSSAVTLTNAIVSSILPRIKTRIRAVIRRMSLVAPRRTTTKGRTSVRDEGGGQRLLRRAFDESTEAPFSVVRVNEPGRTPSHSAVRDTLLRDRDLLDDCVFFSCSELQKVVASGGIQSAADERYILHVVKCATLKVVRRRAHDLLNAVQPVLDEDVCAALPANQQDLDEAIDRAAAFRRMQEILASLSDADRELLQAKFETGLSDYADRHGEPAGTIRCRAKRLVDRLIQARDGTEDP